MNQLFLLSVILFGLCSHWERMGRHGWSGSYSIMKIKLKWSTIPSIWRNPFHTESLNNKISLHLKMEIHVIDMDRYNHVVVLY